MKDGLFSFQNVSVHMGDRAILHNLTFEVPDVQGVALTGVSGSGKTTVLRVLLGLIEHTGEVQLRGEHISYESDNIAMYRKCGVLFQKAGLLNDLTVEENCIIAQELSYVSTYNPEIIHRMLKRLNLWDARHLLPWQLSGGMQHRAGLARALVRDADYIILDEPTTGQDDGNAEVIRDILRDQQAMGKRLIIVSHDHVWLKPLIQWSLLVHEGQMIYQGPLLKAIKTVQEVVE